MCKAIEEMKEVSRNEGILEGIAEGELLHAKKVALKLHEKGSDAKDIADLVDVDIKFIYQWIHEA